MFSDKIQRVALATVGTIVFTTVAVGAAVGPARTAELAPVQVAAQSVTQAHA